jgi:hypothetical protein
MDRSKGAVAQRLAEAHYAVDSAIELIVQLVSPGREGDPKEPIKLLEVNSDTSADGIVPLAFGARPDAGITFPSVIVDVTPEEYEKIKGDPASLPNGWQLGHEFQKAVTAAPV